jgi:DNA end-binding protein Ku
MQAHGACKASLEEERCFVNLPDQEFRPIHARPTHAVDILAFVEAQEISPDYFETPYTLAPAPGGEKVYALLRETLRRSGQIGIAYVVIQSHQRLAAVIPQGQSLILNTLRWSHEYRVPEEFDITEEDMLDLETAGQMTTLPPLPHAGDHRNIFQATGAALEESKMKAKKSERIIVEELEGLLDEDELIDDDYLSFILGRRMHSPDGYALRREQAPRRYRQVAARRRRF